MTAERLSELQERMDVAQTQLLLYQELKNENYTRDGEIALRDLESGLFDLTDVSFLFFPSFFSFFSFLLTYFFFLSLLSL
jgi:hypothetical protein